MRQIVVKFGGSTLATAERITRAAAFIRQEARRRIVVVSAPGKRPGHDNDEKVTDILIGCAAARAQQDNRWEAVLGKVGDRFAEIMDGLPVDRCQFWREFGAIRERIAASSADDPHVHDYIVSRGEYLMGIVMAEVLGLPFHDPAEFVTFQNGGLNDRLTYEQIGARFAHVPCGVVPGFYGSMLSDPERIRTFSRGGSDVTGAIMARGIRALRYENCTDVPGMLAADPRIVDRPVTMGRLTYREAGELAYMGASVLHHDVLYPLAGTGIRTRVLNALDGGRPFTEVTDDPPPRTRVIVGVAGRQGFHTLTIEQNRMHTRPGFVQKLLTILAELGISFEHMPTGLDSLSLVFDRSQLAGGRKERLDNRITAAFPDAVCVWDEGLSVIAVVGEGMKHLLGAASRVCGSLAEAGVNIVFISQGVSEVIIVLGVADADYEPAVRAIYDACVDKECLRRDIPVYA